MRAFGALPPAARAVLVVAATSLFMVLVAWATLVGPDEVFTGPGRSPHTMTPTTQTCTPSATPSPGATTPPAGEQDTESLPECEAPDNSLNEARDLVRQADPPLWLKILVWTFEFLLLAGMLALAIFTVIQARDLARRRTRFGGEREAAEFATLAEPARLAAAITEDAAEQDHLLRDGEPRNAIVATWLRFEVQGASAGVPRRAWETSSEYAIRILDVVAADAGAVNRLAGIYREARFSAHPITEDHRAAAIEALAAIRRSLGART
jgi:hypothetical protein